MPFKYHAEHRHHIPKPRYRVANWAEYDASLRRWGSLTVWFIDEAIQAWRAEPRTTPGGQSHYSVPAITTALTLRAVFNVALRQTEGLIGLLGLDLAVPDHSTLSRRARTLEVPPLRRAGTGPLRNGYNLRAKIEASIGWYRRVIGDALRSRTDRTEATEVAIAAVALNRMPALGRPSYVRIP